MNDEEQLAQRLRGQLDEELGDVQVRAGSRERLRNGMRNRRRVPWLRSSVLVPVAAAVAIAVLVLSIPALLNRSTQVEGVPAGPGPAVTRTLEPTPEPTSSLTDEPGPSAEPTEKVTADPAPRAKTRSSTPARTEEERLSPPRTAEVTRTLEATRTPTVTRPPSEPATTDAPSTDTVPTADNE